MDYKSGYSETEVKNWSLEEKTNALLTHFKLEHNIDADEWLDIMLSVIYANKLWGTEKFGLSVDKVFNSSVNSFIRQQINNDKIELKQGSTQLYNIQYFRLFADTLTIYCLRHNLNIENKSFMMKSSSYIESNIPFSDKFTSNSDDIFDYIEDIYYLNSSSAKSDDLVSVIKRGYKSNPVYTVYILNKYSNMSTNEDYGLDTNTEFYKKVGKKLRYIVKDANLHKKIREEIEKNDKAN